MENLVNRILIARCPGDGSVRLHKNAAIAKSQIMTPYSFHDLQMFRVKGYRPQTGEVLLKEERGRITPEYYDAWYENNKIWLEQISIKYIFIEN